MQYCGKIWELCAKCKWTIKARQMLHRASQMSIKTVKFVQLKEKMPEIGSGWKRGFTVQPRLNVIQVEQGEGHCQVWLKPIYTCCHWEDTVY